MEIVGVLNTVSFILIFISLVVLIGKLFTSFRHDGSLKLIVISFSILFLVTITNVLEHLHISNYFDLFEDELEIIFIPLFIFAAFSYCLKKELQENKAKEQSIKENNLRLNTSVKGANQALWEWHQNQKIFSISKEYYYLDFEPLFYTITESNWQEIIHPETHLAYRNFIYTLKSESIIPENTELLIKTYYGNYKWVLIRGAKTNLNFDNKNITYLGTIIDIGNFKNVQYELERARTKAEESEKLKSAFLNNISHEIRTPMNAIVGFSDLIIEPGLPTVKQKKYMSMIVKGCEDLIHIIEDLIEMSEIVTDSIKIRLKAIESRPFLLEIAEKYSTQAQRNNIEFHYILKSDFVFCSDQVKLTKIICNLIDNSFKYTTKGSIEFGIEKDNNKIKLFVRDTGIGIDKKFHKIIFEYFRQAETSDSRFHSGSGLGLSISKGLITALGGDIWIESEPQKGTTVFFRIPYIKELDNRNENSTLNKIEKSKKQIKILIAEDEESNFLYLNEILLSKVDIILWAKSGQEAIELFSSNRDISLILMDIKMPEMNGYEAAIKIKNIDPSVPVIAQTAYSNSGNNKEFKEISFDDILVKPINKNSLLKVFDKYILDFYK